MMKLGMSVKENVLETPGLETEEDCEEYIHQRGKAWVCEPGSCIAGFSIADLKGNCMCALFVRTGYEGAGIGRKVPC